MLFPLWCGLPLLFAFNKLRNCFRYAICLARFVSRENVMLPPNLRLGHFGRADSTFLLSSKRASVSRYFGHAMNVRLHHRSASVCYRCCRLRSLMPLTDFASREVLKGRTPHPLPTFFFSLSVALLAAQRLYLFYQLRTKTNRKDGVQKNLTDSRSLFILRSAKETSSSSKIFKIFDSCVDIRSILKRWHHLAF